MRPKNGTGTKSYWARLSYPVLSVALAGLSVGSIGALGASGSTNHANSHAKAPITVDVFAPLSGPFANYGLADIPGVKTATSIINAAGGVLGHQINVITTDDLGDVADAVPVAHQLVATNPNLAAVLANPGQESYEVSKIMNDAHIVDLSIAGLDQLNNVALPYFYRVFPPDASESLAWAEAILKSTHKAHPRVVVVGSNTADASSTFPPLITGLRRGGAKVPLYLLVTPDLPSYASVIQRILAQKPDVIAWSITDDQTSSTFATNLKEFGATKIPWFMPGVTPDWLQAVTAALGTTDAGLAKYITLIAPAPGDPRSYGAFLSEFQKVTGKAAPFNAYDGALYDAVMIMAFAMTEAKSVLPKDYNPYIVKITAGIAGSVKVYTYAEGIKAIKQGKQITFIGAGGAHTFNRYHWSTGNWYVTKPAAAGSQTRIRLITAAEIAKI